MNARKTIRKKLLAMHRKLRETRMLAKGLLSTRHPVLVHIIPIRRCNLACTYCNEYDDFSKPVPTEEMFARIDRLGGAAIASRPGRHHRPDSQKWNHGGHDHQRLLAGRRPHRKIESGWSGISANQH